jgi:hypothetical protein
MDDLPHVPRIYVWALAIAALLGPCVVAWVNPGSSDPEYISRQASREARSSKNQRIIADPNAPPWQRDKAKRDLEYRAQMDSLGKSLLFFPFAFFALTIILRRRMGVSGYLVVAASMIVADILIAMAAYSVYAVGPQNSISALIGVVVLYLATWAVLIAGAVVAASVDYASLQCELQSFRE